MKRRMVLITEIIAPYRIPVFNALAACEEVDFHVIFLSETDPSLRQWQVYKTDILFSYQVLRSWRRRLGDYNLLVNGGMTKALNHLQPEVVVCGGYNYLASWQALWWARGRNIPFLLWTESNARDLRSGHAIVEFFKERFLKACSGFVVPGKASLQYLKQLGLEARPVFTAPNAVDSTFFAKTAQRAKQNSSQIRSKWGLPVRYFLYVGRLVTQKGVFEALEAYAKLSDHTRQAVGLLFVGDGEARHRLEEKAREMNSGFVQFVGFAHREDLGAFYSLADALVLPTYTDTWGLVVNEAMACGLPVIVSSAAGCVDDLVEDGGNGYVVPPRDVDALVRAMDSLAQNECRRAQMSARSSEIIESYSPEGWARGMVEAARQFPVKVR
jgi:glycosyltransferase involved in cell wall biosynthesis